MTLISLKNTIETFYEMKSRFRDRQAFPVYKPMFGFKTIHLWCIIRRRIQIQG